MKNRHRFSSFPQNNNKARWRRCKWDTFSDPSLLDKYFSGRVLRKNTFPVSLDNIWFYTFNISAFNKMRFNSIRRPKSRWNAQYFIQWTYRSDVSGIGISNSITVLSEKDIITFSNTTEAFLKISTLNTHTHAQICVEKNY